MPLEMNRREAIALGVASLASLSLPGPVEDADLSPLVQTHAEKVKQLLSAQVTDAQSRWCGGIPDGYGIHYCTSAGNLLRDGAAAYFHPQSQFHASAGKHHQTGVERQEYKCPGKAGCPLAKECVHEKAAARTIVRDEYQETRDTVGRRMATTEGRAVYKQRAPVVEGAFARIKHLMKIRAFLLRGPEKVRTEWCWVCTGYNLKLLMGIAAEIGLKAFGDPQKRIPGVLGDVWWAISSRRRRNFAIFALAA